MQNGIEHTMMKMRAIYINKCGKVMSYVAISGISNCIKLMIHTSMCNVNTELWAVGLKVIIIVMQHMLNMKIVCA